MHHARSAMRRLISSRWGLKPGSLLQPSVGMSRPRAAETWSQGNQVLPAHALQSDFVFWDMLHAAKWHVFPCDILSNERCAKDSLAGFLSNGGRLSARGCWWYTLRISLIIHKWFHAGCQKKPTNKWNIFVHLFQPRPILWAQVCVDQNKIETP